jgi:flagellar assembly protein FliH
MTSSKTAYKNVPPPVGGKTTVYSRFIPREELSAFSAWAPGALNGDERSGQDRRKSVRSAPASASGSAPASAATSAPAEPPAPDTAALVHAARQQGYQDGYRDGLVALDGFKRSFAMQTAAQVSALVRSTGEQLDALQQEMAQALAGAAIELARQIVRSELVSRPELVAEVAIEGLDTLLLSARHISLRVHPDDHALVVAGAAEDLAARGARLISDVGVTRGGCVIESDLGVIDASIEARWHRAAAALGQEVPWDAGAAAVGKDE